MLRGIAQRPKRIGAIPVVAPTAAAGEPSLIFRRLCLEHAHSAPTLLVALVLRIRRASLPGTLRRIRDGWRLYLAKKSDFGAYRRWLRHHPGGSFKQFYIHTISVHLLGKGSSHCTLGPQPIWGPQGNEVLQQLIKHGLRRNDVVVDYGCGTLREGVHLIRYLKAGRYIGLDIDERVLDAGRRLVGEELLAKKEPLLTIINPKSIARVASMNPAWIVSSYVLSQLHPQDLDEYLDNLAKLMEGGGRAVLQVRLGRRTMQYSQTGWYHNQRQMARRLTQRGLVVMQMKVRQLVSAPYNVRGVEARMIVRKRSSTPVPHFPENAPHRADITLIDPGESIIHLHVAKVLRSCGSVRIKMR